MKNKLLIDIDGYSFSERFARFLTSESVVLKIAAFLDVGFLPADPWTHYIPVRMDLTDLEERIKWARENDDKLEQIGKRAR